MKTYFVFGGVYGNHNLLMEKLTAEGFDEKNSDHILISLGDNIGSDRGTSNMFAFFNIMLSKNRIILLKGTQESKLMHFLENDGQTKEDLLNIVKYDLDELLIRLAGTGGLLNLSKNNLSNYSSYIKNRLEIVTRPLAAMQDKYETTHNIFVNTITGDITRDCEYITEKFKKERLPLSGEGDTKKNVYIGNIPVEVSKKLWPNRQVVSTASNNLCYSKFCIAYTDCYTYFMNSQSNKTGNLKVIKIQDQELAIKAEEEVELEKKFVTLNDEDTRNIYTTTVHGGRGNLGYTYDTEPTMATYVTVNTNI